MNAKSIDMNLPIILNEIDRIIGENLDKKILIHTVNYKIARFLESRSKYSGYLYTHDSRNRLRTLQQFKKATAPAILVSPSFTGMSIERNSLSVSTFLKSVCIGISEFPSYIKTMNSIS